jgi:thiol-disulfide isomerase/thioredoxin
MRYSLAPFVAVLLLIGCQAKDVSVSPRSTQPVTSAPEPPVTLEVVDEQGFKKVLESKQGEIVLVDVWATWCVPCRTAFPHTVELQQKYAPQGLSVISLSMDEDDAHSEALDFLKSQDARFTNLRSKMGASDEAIAQFEIDGGAIPHLKLYDRQGNLVKKFISGDPEAIFTQADVELAIRELLAAESP